MNRINRRNFLAGLAPLAGFALSACHPKHPQATSLNAPEIPRLRFLVANDLHFSLPYEGPGVYAGVNRRIEWLLARTRQNDLAGKLDFVLLNGDMIHGSNLEKIQAEMPIFKSVIADAF
ncbi:metallophosphoesterase, partial [bacterium]|nr:metallophosphoesterase [bacterium]